MEVDDDQQVDQQDRAGEAREQPAECAVHRLYLAAHGDARSLGQAGRAVAQHAFDVGADRAEIAILRRREDVVQRCDVVVRHDRVGLSAHDRRETAEQLRRARAARDGQRAQVRQRRHPVLGRLRDDRIRHAVVWVEPVGRRHLARAGQARHHGIGDILLGDAELRGTRAVDRYRELRIGRCLLDARVGNPGHAADAPQQRGGIGAVGGTVRARHLHVDRGGRAEVEDLAHDVGGQERERRAGKRARQHRTQLLDVVGRRRVVARERHEDVAVLRADRAAVAVREVDPAVRQPHVVDDARDRARRHDAAHRLLDVVEQRGRFLDARADRCAHVDRDFARVDRREEIAAEPRHQHERHRDRGQEQRDEACAMGECEAEHRAVAGAQRGEAAFEPLLERDERIARVRRRERRAVWREHGFRMRGMRLQQVTGHHRHERARQHERRDHREDHGFGHRHEQEAGHAIEQQHRHEHDADAQQRHEGRRDDLRRAVEDRIAHVLALFEVPVDVLDRDGGIVDENADRERESAERHHVERLARGRERRDRGQHRERNGGGDDQRRAPAAEEQQDHRGRERGGDQAFARHAAHGALDEHGLVAHYDEPERRRQGRLDARQLRLDARDDVERRRRAAFQHAHQHRATAVDAHDVALRRITVADVRDVAHEDHRAVHGPDRQRVELVDGQRAVVEPDVVFEAADLLRAGRDDLVLLRQRGRDILRGQPLGLQRLRVEIDLHLAHLAAVRRRNRDTGDGQQLRPDHVGRVVAELLFVQGVARQRQLQHGHGRCVVVEDLRWRGARRHLLEHGLRDRRDLRGRGADVDGRLEEDLDDPEAAERLRLDVRNVVDRRAERALVVGDDAPGHVGRLQARVIPHDADDRNPDVGEDVRRRAQRRERPRDQDQQCEDDERVGARERQSDEFQHRRVLRRRGAPACQRSAEARREPDSARAVCVAPLNAGRGPG